MKQPKNPVIKFRLGGVSGYTDVENLKPVMDRIYTAILKKTVENPSKVKIRKLSRTLKRQIPLIYENAIDSIIKHMVGRRSTLGGSTSFSAAQFGGGYASTPTFIPSIGIRVSSGNKKSVFGDARILKWKNLTNPKAVGPNFFRNTGTTKGKKGYNDHSLKQEITLKSRQFIKKAGRVDIIYTEKGRFARTMNSDSRKVVPLANLNITLMKNFSPSALPGVISGIWTDSNTNMSFEKALGFSDEAIIKLKGYDPQFAGGLPIHRALFQPVFSYYTLYEAPKVIGKSIAEAISLKRMK